MRPAFALLCACLLLPLTGSPSLKVEPGCPPDTPGWRHLRDSLRLANRRQAESRPAEALVLYREVRDAASDPAAWSLRARAAWGIGASAFLQRRYGEALRGYLEARSIYKTRHEPDLVADLDANLSSLYRHVGDEESALIAAQRSLDCLTDPRGRRLPLRVQLAALYADRGETGRAEPLFRQGALEAAQIADWRLASNAWDQLGRMLLLTRDFGQAETALQKGYDLRKSHGIPVLDVSLRNLGVLRLEQGRFEEAARLLDEATVRAGKGTVPEWYFYEARARLRLREGHKVAALSDLSVSLDLARDYLASVPNGSPARRAATRVVHRAFDSFIALAARLHGERRDRALLEDAFDAADEYRSWVFQAELRRENRGALRDARYLQLLDALRAAEVELILEPHGPAATKLARVREQMMLFEAAAPWPPYHPGRGRLRAVQRYLAGLRFPAALLLFHTGETQSFVWAVTSKEAGLFSLPGKRQLAAASARFRSDLQADRDFASSGRELARLLFDQLPASVRNAHYWFLSLDEGLYDIPFAALPRRLEGGFEPLIAAHSLLWIPAAASLLADPQPARTSPGAFLGIGDPIYNLADERRGVDLRNFFLRVSSTPAHYIDLHRLPGSGQEVRACLREWVGPGQVITGRDATRERVAAAVQQDPAVIHFATHVVRGAREFSDALLALGVGEAGEIEFLSPEEIAAWRTSATLVVLSGCGSGRGWVSPGSGLMGLVRGWLLAGTRNVVATQWSTLDDSGLLLQRFYAHLRQLSADRNEPPGFQPAEALRLAQLEVWNAGGWQSHFRLWSGHFVMGRP